MLAAAAVSNTTTENSVVNELHAYVSSDQDNSPMAVQYSTANGGGHGNSGGSPAVGAMFSLLAAKRLVLSVSVLSFAAIAYPQSYS